MLFVDPRPVQDKPAAETRLGFDGNVAAVLTQDFLADRKSQTGPASPFGRFENVEDFGQLVLGNAWTVVGDSDVDDIGVRLESGLDDHVPCLGAFNRIDGIRYHIEHCPMDAFDVERGRRQAFIQADFQSALYNPLRRGCINSQTSPTVWLSAATCITGCRSLLNVSMSITSW